MTTIRAFIKGHPLLSYVALTFTIFWGTILLVVGPGGVPVTAEHIVTLITLGYPAMLAAPTLAGIVLTGLVYGKAGFRDLLSRLLRWRVGGRWYAVALLTAPLTMLAVLLALSLASPAFRPLLFVEEDPLGLLGFSIVAGLMVSIFEELGWTGFAVPALLGRRYGVLGTGLIVGFLYVTWDLLIVYVSEVSGPTPGPSRWPSSWRRSSSRGSRPTRCSWCGSTTALTGACRWRCSCPRASSWPGIASATR